MMGCFFKVVQQVFFSFFCCVAKNNQRAIKSTYSLTSRNVILCVFASFNENFNRPRNQTINLISKSSSFNNKSLILMYGQSHDKTKYTTIIGFLENSVFIFIRILLFAILNLVQICTYGKVGIRQKFSCLFHTRPEIWSLLNTRETIFEEKKNGCFPIILHVNQGD